MTRNHIIIRTYPGGVPASGINYEVRTELGNTLLKSGSTDPNGAFDYDANLSPGPFWWQATDFSAEPDAVRHGSSKATDSGGNYSLGELPIAMRLLGTGIIRGYLDELAPAAGSGINYSLTTGAALALGMPANVTTAIVNQAVSSARDAANPRQCYMVLRFEGLGTTEEGKITLTDICGTAAAIPALPVPVQTEARWEEPLAIFRLPATGAGSTLTNFSDYRRFIGGGYATVAAVVRRGNPATVNTVTNTTGTDVLWDGLVTPSVTLLAGATYDIFTETNLLVKAPAGQTVSIMPYLNGTANLAPAVTCNVSADYASLSNTHSRTGVVGDGSSVSCGTLIKVSSGTASYITGTQIVTAVPR